MICENCNKEIDNDSKFCTFCGHKIVKQNDKDVNYSEANLSIKEDITKYDKIGGFLIFVGIILVLGLIVTLTSFNENFTDKYYELMATFYINNNEIFTSLDISYTLTIICLFFLILLNISFFTKSYVTKILAITYFSLLIITDIHSIIIFSKNKEIFLESASQIIKMGIQIVSAILFITYFSISKRVKSTFIKDNNFGFHSIVAFVIPIILFFYYSNKLDETIKNQKQTIIEEKEIFKADLNDLVLNLTDSRGREKLMKLSFSIRSTEPKIANIIEEYKPEIIDIVISQISVRSSEELLTTGGKNLLKDELIQDINNLINIVASSNSKIVRNNVKTILFTDFVIK